MVEGSTTKFPTDHELLSLAGKHAVAKGDFKKAEAFWRLALKDIDAQSHEKVVGSLRSGPEGIADLKAGNPADDAAAVLLSTSQVQNGRSKDQKLAPTHRLPWDMPSAKDERATTASTITGADSTKSLVDELLKGRDVQASTPKRSAPVLTSSVVPAVKQRFRAEGALKQARD